MTFAALRGKGRAFTFVTPEDAEAIGNVEKLTGLTIPTFTQKDVKLPTNAEREDTEERAGPPERAAMPRRER